MLVNCFEFLYVISFTKIPVSTVPGQCCPVCPDTSCLTSGGLNHTAGTVWKEGKSDTFRSQPVTRKIFVIFEISVIGRFP